jgi:DNA topoisomerase-3
MNGITGMLQRMLTECRQIDGEERNRFGTHSGKESIGNCPVCGSPVFEGQKNFYCGNRECRFVLWKENRYLEKMQKKLDKGMVRDLLTNGKTRVKDLYSAKKNAFFTADLLMEWKDGRAMFSLDFPKRSSGKGRQTRKGE